MDEQHVDNRGPAVVVTGAGSGIGRAIATTMAAIGASVAVIDRDERRAADAAVTITRGNGIAMPVCCDVSDENQVVRAIDSVRHQFGAIGVLINSAGVTCEPGMPFTNNTESDWDRTLSTNVKGMFFMAKAAAPDMIARRDGRIVNISSITGVISAAFQPPYSVSKAAVNSLTKVLARDLAPHGVAVNAVCPGFVWTELWEELGPRMVKASGGVHGQSAREVFQNRIDTLVPMRREQTVAEIAATVAFLCSAAARNITGQIISVDGGVTI
jgi:NAD(P)-dependent dehydrogenase (short-subunit alcohol dehydrogenase family)